MKFPDFIDLCDSHMEFYDFHDIHDYHVIFYGFHEFRDFQLDETIFMICVILKWNSMIFIKLIIP